MKVYILVFSEYVRFEGHSSPDAVEVWGVFRRRRNAEKELEARTKNWHTESMNQVAILTGDLA